MKKFITVILLFLATSGCAIMHHTQISEIDSKIVLEGRPFQILVSELGINFEAAAGLAKSFSRHSKTNKDIGKLQEAISMFQMGPRTGNHIFNDKYADKVFLLLKQKCPSGKMSGLTSVRETAKYPVVSGEIVKIIGYCKA